MYWARIFAVFFKHILTYFFGKNQAKSDSKLKTGVVVCYSLGSLIPKMKAIHQICRCYRPTFSGGYRDGRIKKKEKRKTNNRKITWTTQLYTNRQERLIT